MSLRHPGRAASALDRGERVQAAGAVLNILPAGQIDRGGFENRLHLRGRQRSVHWSRMSAAVAVTNAPPSTCRSGTHSRWARTTCPTSCRSTCRARRCPSPGRWSEGRGEIAVVGRAPTAMTSLHFAGKPIAVPRRVAGRGDQDAPGRVGVHHGVAERRAAGREAQAHVRHRCAGIGRPEQTWLATVDLIPRALLTTFTGRILQLGARPATPSELLNAAIEMMPEQYVPMRRREVVVKGSARRERVHAVGPVTGVGRGGSGSRRNRARRPAHRTTPATATRRRSRGYPRRKCRARPRSSGRSSAAPTAARTTGRSAPPRRKPMVSSSAASMPGIVPDNVQHARGSLDRANWARTSVGAGPWPAGHG